jgi:general secretion pathway protein K
VPLRLPPGSAECRRNGGFALIVVLWTLVLIGFIIAHLSANGRTEIRIAGNLVANSASQAAADGAIFEAIFNLSDPRPEQRWPVDGTPRQVVVGSSRVILRVEDEASWINPSTASPLLIEALLRTTGSDADTARRIAAAISEWAGSAVDSRPQGALIADYRAAGLDYGPPGAPFETLGELSRVLGMTPAVLMAIRPHLTLFGPSEPNPATTDPVVAATLALTSTIGSSPTGQPLVQQSLTTTPDAQTVRITALAAGPGNARITRTAVVRTGTTTSPQGYAVLAWGTNLNSDVPPGSPQPPFTR